MRSISDEKKYAEAEARFKKILQNKPNNVSANFNLARTFAESGRHRKAVGIYEKLLQTQKTDAELMYHAAISYAAIGQKEKSTDLLKNAGQIVTDENLAKKILDEIQKSK